MKNDITETLEKMIDQHGLLHVITGLDCVCTEKAMHIRENWQDNQTAKIWDKASNALYTCATKIENLNL